MEHSYAQGAGNTNVNHSWSLMELKRKEAFASFSQGARERFTQGSQDLELLALTSYNSIVHVTDVT